jgi:hypothetical protein
MQKRAVCVLPWNKQIRCLCGSFFIILPVALRVCALRTPEGRTPVPQTPAPDALAFVTETAKMGAGLTC